MKKAELEQKLKLVNDTFRNDINFLKKMVKKYYGEEVYWNAWLTGKFDTLNNIRIHMFPNDIELKNEFEIIEKEIKL